MFNIIYMNRIVDGNFICQFPYTTQIDFAENCEQSFSFITFKSFLIFSNNCNCNLLFYINVYCVYL